MLAVATEQPSVRWLVGLLAGMVALVWAATAGDQVAQSFKVGRLAAGLQAVMWMLLLSVLLLPMWGTPKESLGHTWHDSLLSQTLTIRSQIELYQMQHEGRYPPTDRFWDVMTQTTNVDGEVVADGAGEFGPYLYKPAMNPPLGTDAVRADRQGAWMYDEATGEIMLVARANDLLATGYATWDSEGRFVLCDPDIFVLRERTPPVRPFESTVKEVWIGQGLMWPVWEGYPHPLLGLLVFGLVTWRNGRPRRVESMVLALLRIRLVALLGIVFMLLWYAWGGYGYEERQLLGANWCFLVWLLAHAALLPIRFASGRWIGMDRADDHDEVGDCVLAQVH